MITKCNTCRRRPICKYTDQLTAFTAQLTEATNKLKADAPGIPVKVGINCTEHETQPSGGFR